MHPLTDFKNWINKRHDASQKCIAWCLAPMHHQLIQTLQQPLQGNIIIAIGPEGDFSESEINLAKEKGFKPLSLGNSILRTETAGLYAVSACSLLSGTATKESEAN